ncbi:hypothetical protein C0Q70_01314 [Pomacea canaliculata]|uniref:Uncharacterized protein n=1 Tax=Pomacea canaliculata TaxID=400727 RepID=A0A2T7PZ49_POMCA|nr:hypothetical protein C0Q70_01314 [Pomacea canaliculata]
MRPLDELRPDAYAELRDITLFANNSKYQFNMLESAGFHTVSTHEDSEMDCSGLRQKRLHTDVDDCDECSPISKRINRLQIEVQRIAEDTRNHQQQHHSACGFSVTTAEQSASWQTILPPSYVDECHKRTEEHNTQEELPHQCYTAEQINPMSSSTETMVPFNSQFMYSSPVSHGTEQRYSHSLSRILNIPEQFCQYSCESTEEQLQCSLASCRSQSSPEHQHLSSSEGYSLEIQHPFPSQSSAEVSVQQMSESSDVGMTSGVDRCLVEGYSPDLDEAENPHYFQINQMLFDAHCLRIKRFYSHRTQQNSV